ncbi:MAG TPA: dihydrofolate reductase [Hellea balneolensis]|uniref:Dihydrofolate reductase n=1 Tax=Hellea balneolensis TaxID=287478 RepID=A0A7C5QRV6_9PROT|nr:dihydrofolate reductase [Hellea balneolensis]
MSSTPILSMIVAKSKNNVIGRDGDLPWRLSGDLQHFKRTTLGKPILMGRVTWESLGRALPGRPNFVLTRDRHYKAEGAEVFTKLPDMIGRGFELAGSHGGGEVIIIGGAQLYEACLPHVDRLYITEVEANIQGDAYFPQILPESWRRVSKKQFPQSAKDEYPYSINIYERTGR